MINNGIIDLVDKWGCIIRERQTSLSAMLGNDALRGILQEHSDSMRSIDKSNAFTIFEVISSLYYRENFHSDLLAFFLDPTSNHGYGFLGLELFIEMINNKTGWAVDASQYESAEVFREQGSTDGRIDILIKDDSTHHAILVENKMNNAGDTDRQIPRYCYFLESQGYVIDAAVYLPLTKFKTPDMSSWYNNDYRWLEKIVIIPASSVAEEVSLVNSWLCVLAQNDINQEVASSLRQYCDLIKKLSNQNMDKISFDKLYNYLMTDDHLDSANSLMSMMNDLPKYLAQRILDTYHERCFPFSKVGPYREVDAVFEQCMIDGLYCKMDVWCNTRTFEIHFWAPSDQDVSRLGPYGSIKDFLKEKGTSIFEDYDVADKCKVIKSYPITIPINTIIDSILEQLRMIV